MKLRSDCGCNWQCWSFAQSRQATFAGTQKEFGHACGGDWLLTDSDYWLIDDLPNSTLRY